MLSLESDVVNFSTKGTHFNELWYSLKKEGRLKKEVPLNPKTDLERYRSFLKSLALTGKGSFDDLVALKWAKDSDIFYLVERLFIEINEMLNSVYFSSDNLLSKVHYYFKYSISETVLGFEQNDFLAAVKTYPAWAANIIISVPYFPLKLLLEDSYYGRFVDEEPSFKRWREVLIRNRRDELLEYLKKQLKEQGAVNVPDEMIMNITGYGKIEREYKKLQTGKKK